MGKIIIPGEHDGMTATQKARAVLPEELPPCVGNAGNRCPHPVQPVMISGYDDKMRCPACNKVHVALVEQEAGNDSNPNTPPQFVAARLDGKANSRREQILQRNAPRDGLSSPPVIDGVEGDPIDMKTARSRDDHGTRAVGISNDERRKRILAKYGR